MSDKSNKYGYLTDVPQSFGNNKGVFSVNEVYDLSKADKWTNYGQLELIETQTVTSAVAGVDFTSLGDYNVHFLTVHSFSSATDYGAVSLRVSTDGGSSFKTSGYQYATQYATTTGFGEFKSTNYFAMTNFTGPNAGASPYSANCYIYLYNLLDSSKYSFATANSTSYPQISSVFECYMTSAVYSVAETNNAIRIYPQNASNVDNATISLYGIAES
jgi:hypothetical protein